ncbi:MAG TPA: hypothetical protein VMD75_10290 [Candidatus Binataceae bacterium]|nr:hypothetical protein [Candidatus Binataceae bacterium]
MNKRRKAGPRYDRHRLREVYLASDRGPVRGRFASTGRLKLFLILLAFVAVGSGFFFARTRIPADLQFRAHDSGAQYIPGTSVRFGQDAPANSNDTFGEAVDPDTTQVPAPQAEDQDAGGTAAR